MSHMKRLTAPRSWAIEKKVNVWTTKPEPGAHPLKMSIPISTILRNYLKICDNLREAKKIVNDGAVLVDGRVVKRHKWGVGLMDVLSLPATKDYFRVILDKNGKIQFSPIKKTEAGWKLRKVEGKTSVRGGKTQINFHDGSNLIYNKKCKVGDVFQIEIPSGKIKKIFEMKKGAHVYITGGTNVGSLTKIKSGKVTRGTKVGEIVCDGFETVKPYVFVVGDTKKSLISVEERKS